MISEVDKLLAKQLWDYHHVNHVIEKSDCILVLGSHDTRVADRGAELYLQGFAILCRKSRVSAIKSSLL